MSRSKVYGGLPMQISSAGFLSIVVRRVAGVPWVASFRDFLIDISKRTVDEI
jgi:hypothetical protein